MRQVVQRRKRRSVRQSRRRLDDAGLAVRASVGDLEHAAGLAAQLPRDGVEIRPLNHREGAHWAEPARRWRARRRRRRRDGRRNTVRRIGDGVPQRRVPRVARSRGRGVRCRASPGTPALGGNCTWYGMSPGITKPSRSRACAAMNTGSASLTFCSSRSAICARSCASVAANCFISVRCAKYVRTGPAMVKVSTQTTAARIAARRAAEPNRCSDCCSADSAIDSRIESRVRLVVGLRLGPRLGLARLAPRGEPGRRAAAPASPDLPGLPGREAGDRRFGSGRFASGTGYLRLSAPARQNRGNARSPA